MVAMFTQRGNEAEKTTNNAAAKWPHLHNKAQRPQDALYGAFTLGRAEVPDRILITSVRASVTKQTQD